MKGEKKKRRKGEEKGKTVLLCQTIQFSIQK